MAGGADGGVKGVGGAGGGFVRQWGMKALTSWAPPKWHLVPSVGVQAAREDGDEGRCGQVTGLNQRI